MEKPRLNEHHRRLEKLIGVWQGEEVVGSNPTLPPGRAQGHFTLSPALDGFFLIGDYVERMDGETTLAGHAVIGWNAQKQLYTLHWFDTFGIPPSAPGFGHFEGDALVFEHHLPTHEGRTTFASDGHGFLFKVEMKREGKDWSTAVEGKYQRSSRLRAVSIGGRR